MPASWSAKPCNNAHFVEALHQLRVAQAIPWRPRARTGVVAAGTGKPAHTASAHRRSGRWRVLDVCRAGRRTRQSARANSFPDVAVAPAQTMDWKRCSNAGRCDRFVVGNTFFGPLQAQHVGTAQNMRSGCVSSDNRRVAGRRTVTSLPSNNGGATAPAKPIGGQNG